MLTSKRACITLVGSPNPHDHFIRHLSSTRCSSWGSSRSATPVPVDDRAFQPAALDFGPDSVDGWLTRMAAAEVGVQDAPFLDVDDRTVDLGDHRVRLSPLEFGVLEALSSRRGRPVSHAELIAGVWGTTYGGSNVVDVVVRSLRHKLGPARGGSRPPVASATASNRYPGSRGIPTPPDNESERCGTGDNG